MGVYRIENWNQPTPPNPAMLRFLLEREGYRVFQWSDNPGTVYGNHKHDDDQSHWVISGSLELTVERAGTFVLETGDRDFLPAGTYHSARVIGEEPVMYLVGAK
jgi:quercetin dioxygenase-like cupin family protein